MADDAKNGLITGEFERMFQTCYNSAGVPYPSAKVERLKAVGR
jgi:hypothetical protein